MTTESFDVNNYIRQRFFPHLWCPGCGHGIILGALLRAVHRLGLDKNDIVMTSGIGCSSRISGYVDFHTLHTVHGRALAFATGVKLARPNLKLIVPMGDGDALAIGGNHFIHAARRNIDITVFIMNNSIYGMTGGQFSPLSGRGTKASTAPYKTIDNSFDIMNLAKSAGATFVARSTTFHAAECSEIMERAIQHKGFSVVEILSQCPTFYGRQNKAGDAIQMLENFRKNTAKSGSAKLKKDPCIIERGVIFESTESPEYCEAYENMMKKTMKGAA